MAEIDGYIGGIVHDRCFIDGSEVAQIYNGGKKIFDSSISVPTDYLLAYDFNGNLLDNSVYGNNGAVTSGSASWDSGAFVFTGTNGIRTNNNVPYSGTNIITISLWVHNKQIDNPSNTLIFETGNNTLGSSNSIGIMIKDDVISILNSQSGAIKDTRTFNVIDGWNHILLTIDRSESIFSDKVNVFLNGNQITLNAISVGITTGNLTSTRSNLGYIVSPLGNYFKGKVKKLRIYKRVLSYEEKIALYQE